MPIRNPKKGFNVHERIILFVLDRARRPLSQRQIAEKSGMAWRTTKTYVSKLEKEGYLSCNKRGRKKMCKIGERKTKT